jgi:exodeoxyribonuclease-3
VKIATWNINSVRARVDRLLEWLVSRQPDVVCLQETKCTDEQFPALEVHGLGYQAHLFGQKSYNGVAILSKIPVADVRRNMGDDDEQARIITGTIKGLRVVCLYAPNGQAVESEAYRYKLTWYAALTRWLSFARGEPLLVCGDFNVAPHDIDVYSVPMFSGLTLFSDKERAALSSLMTGHQLVDLFRTKHPEARAFSWWDYREGAFKKDRGLRIDHMLVGADVLSKCRSVEIDKQAREGKLPSDHAPLIATFDW